MNKDFELKMKRNMRIAKMVKQYFIEEIGFKHQIQPGWKVDSFSLNVYVNEYDYNTITVKTEDNVPEFEYISRAIYLNGNRSELQFHEATPEEVYIINIIKRHSSEHLYTMGNELCSEISDATLGFKEIRNLDYDKTFCVLKCIEAGGAEFIIDLDAGTIKEIN